MSASLAGFYASSYAVPGAAPYARLADAAALIERLGLLRFRAPPPFDPGLLRGLHDDRYLDAFLHGDEPLASSQGLPWSPAVREASLAMLGGQVAAVEHALAHGIAFNLARGFHHAVPQRGSGNCALNGFALIAHLRPALRVFVVDCDEHGGNGTEEFSARYGNLFCASVFGTRFGCLGGPRSWNFPVRGGAGAAAQYREALAQVERLMDTLAPDVVLYQAGVDCHRDDPKNSVGLDTRALFRRDLQVIGAALQRGIPLVVCVGGGYQSPARIARLNANTVRAARLALRQHAGAETPRD